MNDIFVTHRRLLSYVTMQKRKIDLFSMICLIYGSKSKLLRRSGSWYLTRYLKNSPQSQTHENPMRTELRVKYYMFAACKDIK